MNEQEQRIAIAEACGHKAGFWFCPHCYSTVRPEEVTFEELHETCRHKVAWNDTPDYLHDLNAMYDAELTLENGKWFKYAEELDTIVNPHIRMTRYRENWCLIRATASQRSEAFLRTIGRWKD